MPYPHSEKIKPETEVRTNIMNQWNNDLSGIGENTDSALVPARANSVQVETYNGYKGGEKPSKIIFSGRSHHVEEVLETSRVRRADNQGDEEHFKVKIQGYGEMEVVYHHSWDGWTLNEKITGSPFSELIFEK